VIDFALQWLLLGLPVAFALGWIGARLESRQWQREQRDAPRAYYQGLNLLLNEQQDKAIDAFIEAVQHDPDTTELHFALGNLFRRRGEFERAVRVHQHLLQRADLATTERDRAQFALAQDYTRAGLVDRAEQAWRALEGTPFETDSRLALLGLYEASRDWRAAAEVATRLEQAGAGSFASRIAHHWCELALEADARGHPEEAEAALQRAREVAPQAPRPWLIQLQRGVRAGDPAQAFASGVELSRRSAAVLLMVAADFVASAVASGQRERARALLAEIADREPGIAALRALDLIEGLPPGTSPRWIECLRQRPTLSAALEVLSAPAGSAAVRLDAEPVRTGLRDAVASAARPLQRYRCAACGFEVQQYYWRCPGCSSWDSLPPRCIEEL
jgi:lipopolysaccharide biosynthesis regulator YciM